MKDIKKGSNAIAAVICRVIDYHVAVQALAVAQENGFDSSTTEGEEYVQNCLTAETRIADAVANIAIELTK